MLSRSDPGSEVPRLDILEFVGEYQGSGSNRASYLLRRADGRMLEVSPLIYAVASNIDGERDLDAVASRVTEHIGRPISAGSVAYLIQHKLRPLDLVAADASAASSSAAPPILTLGLRRSLLGKRAVRAAAGVLRPLFWPPVLSCVLGALLAADVWLLITTDVLESAKEVIYHPELLLAVWALMALGGLFHELGHASATRYGGAEPGPIGIGIYLVWPAFYNDLTDSYRLTRAGRLRADLGGVYFNAVFILVLAGAYGATRFQPLLVVIALQHVVVAQQFLPFARLDGYYVLSDFVGVPDLFSRIKPILSSEILGRSPDPSVAALTPRALAAVTTWVIVTVPVLAASIAVLVVRLPHLVQVARDSMVMHAAGLSQAAGAGEPLLVLLSAIQLTVLTVPSVGAAVVVARLLRRLFGSVLRRKACSAPATLPPRSQLAQARMDRIMAFSLPAFHQDATPALSLGFDALEGDALGETERSPAGRAGTMLPWLRGTTSKRSNASGSRAGARWGPIRSASTTRAHRSTPCACTRIRAGRRIRDTSGTTPSAT